VTAAVENETLITTVEDDGVGLGGAPSSQAGSGLGLTSVQARLQHLYGSGQQLEVKRLSPSGTRITIAIPYRTAAP
jgi:LytS/YehU family sensor histidine kinase